MAGFSEDYDPTCNTLYTVSPHKSSVKIKVMVVGRNKTRARDLTQRVRELEYKPGNLSSMLESHIKVEKRTMLSSDLHTCTGALMPFPHTTIISTVFKEQQRPTKKTRSNSK